ncbi:MAG TPA: cytochrome C oxidase subunit IV family protein [Polyangiaceae bacterium]|jgi:cytochrome c oxidase subunit 4
MAPLLPGVGDADSGAERAHARKLALAGLALLALAGLSFGLSYLRLAAWALPIALLIAVAKASLVLSCFMEFWREAVSVRLAALTALVMLLLLATFTIADVATRERPPLLPPEQAALTPLTPTGALPP